MLYDVIKALLKCIIGIINLSLVGWCFWCSCLLWILGLLTEKEKADLPIPAMPNSLILDLFLRRYSTCEPMPNFGTTEQHNSAISWNKLAHKLPEPDYMLFVPDQDSYEESTKKAAFSLIKAAARGSLDDLCTLLYMGVDPNESCNTKTALCEAVTRGRYACAKALLTAGADPNLAEENGVSPLMIAISCNQGECLGALIAHPDIKVDTLDATNKTPIMYAASGGYFLLTKLLLQKIANGIEPLQRRDIGLESVLTHAAVNGQRHYLHALRPMLWFIVDIVKCAANDDSIELRRLLEEDRRDPNQTDFGGLTALMVCCMMDHRECFKVLRDFPIEIHKWDDTGRLAIHYAAGCGNFQCMGMLIELGASVSLASRLRETALSLAAKNGFANCVDVAISAMRTERTRDLQPPFFRGDNQIDFDHIFEFGYNQGQSLCSFEAFDLYDKTAMVYASERGFYQIVKMLLDNGAKSNTRSCISGKNALIYAASCGHTSVVELLLANRAKVNAADRTGGSALYYAASEGHLDCVLVLLRAGATINTTAMFKNSALAVALDRGHTECAVAMIRGMSRDQLARTDVRGMNWTLFATKSGDLTCLKLLFEAGMDWTNRYVDNSGNTPLMYAAANSRMEMMEFLITDLGMAVDERNASGLNALDVAMFYDSPDPIITYLIRKNVSVQANPSAGQSCPLFHACLNGNASHIRILLAAGADVSYKDHHGDGCVNYVTKKNKPEAVRLIFDAERAKGLLVPDKSHKKALLYAIDSGYTSVVALFLQAGIFDWNWYPHCMLNIRGTMRVLLMSLVSLGISPGVFQHNSESSSPLDLALQYNDIATAKYIISNLYFSYYDYTNVLKNKTLPMSLGSDWSVTDNNLYGDFKSAKVVANNLFSNPLPLTTLSFLTISTAIGQHCGLSQRADAVETLPLPQHFKTKLAFQEPVAKLCNHDWRHIDLEEREHGSGRCRRVYRLFEECTQLPNPFSSTHLYQCKRRYCLCGENGLSFYEGREEQEETQQRNRRQVLDFEFSVWRS